MNSKVIAKNTLTLVNPANLGESFYRDDGSIIVLPTQAGLASANIHFDDDLFVEGFCVPSTISGLVELFLKIHEIAPEAWKPTLLTEPEAKKVAENTEIKYALASADKKFVIAIYDPTDSKRRLTFEEVRLLPRNVGDYHVSYPGFYFDDSEKTPAVTAAFGPFDCFFIRFVRVEGDPQNQPRGSLLR